MSKTISCSSCGQKFNIAPTLLGRRVKCSKCGNKIDIPLPVAKRLDLPAKPTADSDLALQALGALIPDGPFEPDTPELPGLVPLSPAPSAAMPEGLEPLGLVPMQPVPDGLVPDGLVPLGSPNSSPLDDPFSASAGLGSPGLDMASLGSLGSAAQSRSVHATEPEDPGTMRLIYICTAIAGTAMLLLLVVIAVNAYQKASAERQLAIQNAPAPPVASSPKNTTAAPLATTSAPMLAAPATASTTPASGLVVPKFPDLGAPQTLPSGVLSHSIDLTNFAGNDPALPGMAMQMRVLLPPGDHPPKSLACVLIASAGTNLLRGNDLDTSDKPTELLPYALAGMAVVHFSLDGAMPESTPQDEVSQVKAMTVVYPKFKAAQAGILNGRYALEFALAKLPQVDSEKIYSAGHSSAATVSLLFAAHEPRVKACIAYAPVTNLEQGPLGQLAGDATAAKLFPGIADYLKQYSPTTHAAQLRCPLFLFHARDDSNQPFANSAAFAQQLTQLGGKPTLAEVPTGDHYDSMVQQGIPQAIAWLKALPASQPQPASEQPSSATTAVSP